MIARCPSRSQNAHDEAVLAWARGASRRDQGLVGEKVRAVKGNLGYALFERASEIGGGCEAASMVSVLAESHDKPVVAQMRAMETIPAASLDAGEELALVGHTQWGII